MTINDVVQPRPVPSPKFPQLSTKTSVSLHTNFLVVGTIHHKPNRRSTSYNVEIIVGAVTRGGDQTNTHHEQQSDGLCVKVLHVVHWFGGTRGRSLFI